MEAVTYSTFRNSLRSYLDKTCEDAEPILVTSKNPESNVIVINARDYDNLIENLYVLSNGYLSHKIEHGLAQMREGATTVHELIEVDDD